MTEDYLPDGTVLNGRYTIKQALGSGGFGITYKVYDSLLDKDVAIKEYFPAGYARRSKDGISVVLISAEYEAEYLRNIKNFLYEARFIARFHNHPNIIQVEFFFELNNTAYYVMEYLEGSDLREYISKYRNAGEFIEQDTAVRIVGQILRALSALHSEKIIHRDIKPSNIYVTRNGSVKLLDFGLARQISEDGTGVELTQGYAPYEQYVAGRQGAYTDIYSVGAVLYELLTLRRPDTALDRKLEDVLPAPSEKNPDVEQRISDAVMRALSLNPRYRFKSAAVFIKALEGRGAISLSETVKRKKALRIAVYAVAAIVSAAAVCGIIYYGMLIKNRNDESKEIRICLPDEYYTESKVRELIGDFCANFQDIDVDVRIIPADEYKEYMADKKEKGELPEIYDSAAAGVETENTMVLIYDIPVLYYNSVYVGSDGMDLEQAYGYTDIDAFVGGEVNLYYGTIRDYSYIQDSMAGRYGIYELDNYGDRVALSALAVNADKDSYIYEAVSALVIYLDSDIYQKELCVDGNAGFPSDMGTAEMFVQVNPEFEYLLSGRE